MAAVANTANNANEGMPIMEYQNMRLIFHCFVSISNSFIVDIAMCNSTTRNI